MRTVDRAELDSVTYDKWFVEGFFHLDRTVKISLAEGIASQVPEELTIDGTTLTDIYPLQVSSASRRFEIRFDYVYFFQAYDELRHKFDYDQAETGVVAQCSKSRMMEFVESATTIEELDLDEKFQYVVRTGDFWFHILSDGPPTIRRIDP